MHSSIFIANGAFSSNLSRSTSRSNPHTASQVGGCAFQPCPFVLARIQLLLSFASFPISRYTSSPTIHAAHDKKPMAAFTDREQVGGRVTLDPSCSSTGRLTVTVRLVSYIVPMITYSHPSSSRARSYIPSATRNTAISGSLTRRNTSSSPRRQLRSYLLNPLFLDQRPLCARHLRCVADRAAPT